MKRQVLLNLTIIIPLFIVVCYNANSQAWKEMMDSTELNFGKGNYKAAIYWAEKCEKLKVNEGHDTNYIRILSMIYQSYFYLGKPQKAIEYCNKAMPIIGKVQGEDSFEYGEVVGNLGYFYSSYGLYEEAEPLLMKAVGLNRKLFTGDNPHLAGSINNLAMFYEDRGRYEEAEKLYDESLGMQRRIFKEDSPELAITIDNMASFYNNRGRFGEAEALYLEALGMFRRLNKDDNSDLAISINNMAGFYQSRNRYLEAEKLFKESLEMKRRLYADDHPELATSISDIACFYENTGNYGDAEKFYKEALAMSRRIYKHEHPYLSTSINNMAYFYRRTGRFTESEKLYKEALEMDRLLYKGDHLNLATCINNVAVIYESKGDYSMAEKLYKESLDMFRRLYKGDYPNLASNINNLANFYCHIGNGDAAEQFYKEAVEMRRRISKGFDNDLALNINNLALFYTDKGRFSEAEPLYREAHDMYLNFSNGKHQNLSHIKFNMADFYFIQGKASESEILYKDALDININMLNNYFPSLSENEKKLFWNTVSNNFEGFNSFAVKRASENPAITCNMYDMQLYSKALLLNSTSKVRKRILNSNDSNLIDKYKEWADKKELLVKIYTMTEDERKKKGFNVDSIEKITNELEKEISLKSELYAQSYEKKKVTWKTIQAVLKPDEAAVEVVRFRYYDKRRFTDTIYYAFLIVTDQTEEHPDIIVIENGKQLENEFYNDYRKNIKSKGKDKNSFARYWGKLNEKLKGYKKIYFSADGIYNKLNPATLLMPDGKYLLDIQDIQQVNSTKDLLMGYYQTKQESNIYNSALLIGNPNFSLSESQVREASKKIRSQQGEDYNFEQIASTRGIELTNLPGTEKEIKDIEKFLKSKKWDVNSYLGDMAVKTAVKSANNPRIVHIATHGMFLEDVKLDNKEMFGFEEKKLVENPLLRSGLFFTGADNYLKSDSTKPTGDENGLLTAYEAMNLDLDKTELVVLSACETGLGEIQNGEGVFGLRRAFQQAGAKAVIMSLWSVNDEATQELMSSFYKNWITGMTKRDAFSKAQLEIKNKYHDPYYWGAFVMVGE